MYFKDFFLSLIMVNIPDDLKYLDSHEWVKVEGDIAIVGISDHAQEQLGDIVFVELPSVGDAVSKGDASGAVESAKAVGDLNMPVSGEIIEVNEALEGEPEIVNNSPYDDGWILKIKTEHEGHLIFLIY